MSSFAPNLLRDEMCESRRKMERPIEIQRHLVCAARKMTKALPPVISFASFHPLIIALSFSLVVLVPFLPIPLSVSCLFSCFFPIFHFSSLALIFTALPLLPHDIFVPLLPPSSSHPLSSPPSPIPHLQTPIYLSVTLFFCFPCVSSSMSSPRCVVIVARLATAATADSRAVGTNRGRAGGERGDDDGGKRGCEDEETLIHGRVGGGGYFFC